MYHSAVVITKSLLNLVYRMSHGICLISTSEVLPYSPIVYLPFVRGSFLLHVIGHPLSLQVTGCFSFSMHGEVTLQRNRKSSNYSTSTPSNDHLAQKDKHIAMLYRNSHFFRPPNNRAIIFHVKNFSLLKLSMKIFLRRIKVYIYDLW